MILLINILIFIFFCILLYIAGELIVKNILKLAKYLGVTEFVVAFFVMAVAASLPNLFVGVTSALRGVSELSFGDIMGNNMIAMTLAVGLAIFFSPTREIPADGKTIQKTALFTIISAILPVILISDGVISRIDGMILIGLFIYYIFWLFSKKERFSRVYDKEDEVLEKNPVKEIKLALSDIIKLFGGGAILLIAAQGIVFSATEIAKILEFPLVLVGILILGFGSALPEVYFGISSAKKGETQMILGNLMGAVIIPASLVVGIISIINPIKSEGLEFPIINRFFLIVSAILFLLFAKTRKRISKKEGCFLISLYILFIITTLIYINL